MLLVRVQRVHVKPQKSKVRVLNLGDNGQSVFCNVIIPTPPNHCHYYHREVPGTVSNRTAPLYLDWIAPTILKSNAKFVCKVLPIVVSS